MDATANDLFSQLTPEQLSALLQGDTLQDQGGLLAQQLQDLLQGGMQHQEHTTPLGAGLGGIAEAMDGTANAFHAKALRGQQQQNIDAQGKLMGDFGALLRGPQQAPPAAGPMQGTEVTPEWGMDLSQPPPSPMQGTEVTPQWGLDLSQPSGDPSVTSFPTPTQPTPIPSPANQTEIVENGSDGWGLDLSHPGQAEAIAKALRGPAQLASRKPVPQSIHPGMPQRRPRLDDEELSPFGY